MIADCTLDRSITDVSSGNPASWCGVDENSLLSFLMCIISGRQVHRSSEDNIVLPPRMLSSNLVSSASSTHAGHSLR